MVGLVGCGEGPFREVYVADETGALKPLPRGQEHRPFPAGGWEWGDLGPGAYALGWAVAFYLLRDVEQAARVYERLTRVWVNELPREGWFCSMTRLWTFCQLELRNAGVPHV